MPRHFSLSRYFRKHKTLSITLGCGLTTLSAFVMYGLLAPMGNDKASCIYVSTDTTIPQLREQVSQAGSLPQRVMFDALAFATGYYNHIHAGRYEVAGLSTIMAFHQMHRGSETPVRLTIPSTLRTTEDLCDYLSMQLMPSYEDFHAVFTDATALKAYGLTQETAVSLFLPNTYEVYWSSDVDHVFERMQRESEAFWENNHRDEKRGSILNGLSRAEVITLASIVEQETQNAAERPAVAGMYINRIQKKMPLQADPTVKFALNDFSIKRIMHKHLEVDSPYNTYRNTGLPPGPICLPSLNSIDAVLNYQHHNYIYMCAKEDFSGTHNFATSYAEHLKNAARYADALNQRGIK